MNQAILIGGPCDGEWIDLENSADHQVVSVEIIFKEEEKPDRTERFNYQVNPIVGQEQTWHIGRAAGVEFDEAISHILRCYHITSNRRGNNDKFASHERDSRRDTGRDTGREPQN